MALHRILLDPDPSGTAGGGGSTEVSGETKTGGGEFDATKAVDSLAKRYGGLDGALKHLVAENYEYRDEIRQLKGKAPKEGSIVLEGDNVKHWNSYRELGAPTDLKKVVEERDGLKKEVGGYQKKEVVGKAAKIAGFEAEVLSTLAANLEIEITSKVEGGKTLQSVVVKHDDKTTPLEDFAKANWAAFLPALKPQAARVLGTPAGTSLGSATPPATERKSLYKGKSPF